MKNLNSASGTTWDGRLLMEREKDDLKLQLEAMLAMLEAVGGAREIRDRLRRRIEQLASANPL